MGEREEHREALRYFLRNEHKFGVYGSAEDLQRAKDAIRFFAHDDSDDKLRAERDELLAAKPIDKLRNLLVDWHVDFSQEQPDDVHMHLCVPLFATRFIFAAGNGRFMGVQAIDCEEKRDG